MRNLVGRGVRRPIDVLLGRPYRSSNPELSPNPSPAHVETLADRDSRVEAAFRHAYPKTSTTRIRRTSAAGWRSGVEDGARADIGTTRLGGGRRPEIG